MSGSISPEQLESMQAFLTACKELSMIYAIVDNKSARAAMDNKSAVIVQDLDEPMFSGPEGYALGITRIPILVDRLGLVSSHNKTLNLAISDKKKYFTMLTATTDTHDLEFRFADPDGLLEHVPKAAKGSPLHTFHLTDVQVKQLSDAARAFQPDRIWFHVTPKGIKIDMFDSAVGDKVSIAVSKEENIISSVSYKYDAATIMRLLNQKTKSVELSLLTNGLLRVNYKGVTVYALRKETAQ